MTDATVWTIIAALGLGTYLSRFAFLGLIGDRPLPPWLLRHLRYTGVAVLPGLVAPLLVWPEATGGELDPLRLLAAAVALGVGVWRKDVVVAAVAGALVMGLGSWLLA
ncbi:AzlD domain-containing protein [Jannaschia seohaensis]|uniref:Branched-chain amino acid transport protein n=1 Tax=Jannaschia seohaensis TaxID=475081 RepID=A0A2Y9A1H2_9RHOB|nr:AzlD domain-containing protein [Jannaschia seohaensis]PWJ22012.1 branched-subunit amino acid transport protein [Jannaschia seohaensis]SSA38290.1 Branched-chain amino acid transport protein [Jannaschia seohaensis]